MAAGSIGVRTNAPAGVQCEPCVLDEVVEENNFRSVYSPPP